jgi:uncharacterized protein (TIGR02118 family)
MVKTVGFMPRRPDLTRDAFRAYYETRHAPLAVPRFPFRRYRRNHLADPAAEPGFDCISEFWVGSLEPIGALMAGEVGDLMRADERNFLDQPRIRVARAEPVATASDAGGTIALLVSQGGDPDALATAAQEVGAGLDLLTAMDEGGSPGDALLRFDGAAPRLPTGWACIAQLRVLPCETDPATLMG